MQKFKLRSNDLDTLYSIFKHSSLTPLDIKQLRQNKFFYTYTPDCPILFNMAGRNFLYFFKEVNDRDEWE